jgi:hypothetical protein
MGDAAVGDLIVPPTPTLVADSDEGENALEDAERTARTLTVAGIGSAAAAEAAADAEQRAGAAEPPESAGHAPQPPAQGSAAQPTPAARADHRERSPRRDPPAHEGRVRWADQTVEDETPQLSAAQEAAIRGDALADSVDSLPRIEEETPQPPTSNQRGGGSLT